MVSGVARSECAQNPEPREEAGPAAQHPLDWRVRTLPPRLTARPGAHSCPENAGWQRNPPHARGLSNHSARYDAQAGWAVRPESPRPSPSRQPIAARGAAAVAGRRAGRLGAGRGRGDAWPRGLARPEGKPRSPGSSVRIRSGSTPGPARPGSGEAWVRCWWGSGQSCGSRGRPLPECGLREPHLPAAGGGPGRGCAGRGRGPARGDGSEALLGVGFGTSV